MPDDASNDWLDVAKTRAKGIRAALAGIGVFVVCVLVTIFGQFQKIEADTKAEKIAACFVPNAQECPFGADMGTLKAAYEEYPTSKIDAELDPWNQFAMESTLVATFTEGIDPNKFAGNPDPTAKFFWLLEQASLKTPVKTGTTSEISHFYLHFKAFDSDVKSIEGALAAKTPFENLDRNQIIALANAYTFKLDSDDIKGEYAAQGLANKNFLSELNRLRPTVLNAEGHPIVEEKFVQTLETGASLDLLTTLRQQLVGIDLGKFQAPDDAELTRFRGFLTGARFASLAAEQDEYTRLNNELTNMLQNGDLTAPISLPFVNLAVGLSAFASLSGILNLAFLGWMFWQAQQMDDACGRYMVFADADRQRVAAVLQGLPGASRLDLPSRIGIALLVSMPALLGTVVFFVPVWFLKSGIFRWYSLLYLLIPAVVFVLSLALARFIQMSNRRVLYVPSQPQSGAPSTAS